MLTQTALTPSTDPDPEAHYAKICVADWDGVLRGKYLRREKLLDALSGGAKFCEVLFGWDLRDTIIGGLNFAGWQSGFPDGVLRILPETARPIPYEGGLPLYLAEFTGRAGAVCPRSVLKRVLERASRAGFEVIAAVEFEFFLFAETPASCREKGYRNLAPITPGSFGYSLLREGLNADFFRELLDICAAMRMPIEGLHTETGPGVIEAALCHAHALEAADRAVLFKTVAKILAQRRGWMATFMAKWSQDWPGQSGHLHLSLRRDGRSAFTDTRAPDGLSRTMRHFVAGQLALLPELTAMVAPTVNSYKRLVPGHWAPTAATWGLDNRTCAVRVIPGSDASQRVEYRVTAADVNPYLALAAAIGSGLWGVEHELELPPPVSGNAYEAELPPSAILPASLREAARRLTASRAARELFGDTFVDHFGASREWESRAVETQVTDRELDRYFEII